MNAGTLTRAENRKVTASGVVDPREDFFQDHFPLFPVVPGVLLLEILKKNAERYFGQSAEAYHLKEVSTVKFSQYLRPGDAWDAELDLTAEESGVFRWKGKLSSQGRAVCSAQFSLQKKV